MASNAFEPHDHTGCTNTALERADQLALERGLRLTPVRRKTLEILLQEHRALGAYDVLEHLAAAGFGSQPPVAYRALDFLVENGLAHRVRRLNAFMACLHVDSDHVPVFFICKDCSHVAEAPVHGVKEAMEREADALGFSLDRMNAEAVGQCPACKAAA